MKLLFVVNPISGGKNKEIFLNNAEAYCKKYGIEWEYFHTTGEDDVQKLASAVQEVVPDRVVSIGGDGTTLMTSLALQNVNIPFGIIPMGSANGMAKELSVPNDPMHAFKDLVVSQIIVPLDLVKVNDDYTIHLGDVGINAYMVENFAKEAGRGWTAYAKHFVDAVAKASTFNVTIETSEKTYSHKAYSIIIANTRMYGTGAIVNPEGNPHDGKFEIVVVTKNDWSGIINLGLSAIDPRALDALEGYAEIYQVKSAKIAFEEPQMLQLDGEIIGKCKTIEAEIIPAGVQFISTNDNIFVKDILKDN
jgi:YegS/Rv2252/BmrU family lipid kinase